MGGKQLQEGTIELFLVFYLDLFGAMGRLFEERLNLMASTDSGMLGEEW